MVLKSTLDKPLINVEQEPEWLPVSPLTQGSRQAKGRQAATPPIAHASAHVVQRVHCLFTLNCVSGQNDHHTNSSQTSSNNDNKHVQHKCCSDDVPVLSFQRVFKFTLVP